MSIKELNNFINKTVDHDMIRLLSDDYMLSKYRRCRSVVLKIKTLSEILIKNRVHPEQIQRIIDDYFMELIPPGLKGCIRGNVFNELIRSKICSLNLDPERFEVCFEKQHENFKCDEIPDWYIFDRHKKKLMIGMNQIDLWGGGHQTNRASKYILSKTNKTYLDGIEIRFMNVICNHTEVKTLNSKMFKILSVGFENKILCYPTLLTSYIGMFFH